MFSFASSTLIIICGCLKTLQQHEQRANVTHTTKYDTIPSNAMDCTSKVVLLEMSLVLGQHQYHSFHSLSYDRPIASSKVNSPQSMI
jgi:uncharacterized membrane protein